MAEREPFGKVFMLVLLAMLGMITVAACIALFQAAMAARRTEQLMINANDKLNRLEAKVAQIEQQVRPDMKAAYDAGKEIIRDPRLKAGVTNWLAKKLPPPPPPAPAAPPKPAATSTTPTTSTSKPR